MTPFEERKNMLAAGSRQAQVALASMAASRVVAVFDQYWVGDHTEAPARAIEMGWSFALGSAVSVGEVHDALNSIRGFVEYYNDEGIGILAASVTVALRVCEGLAEPDQADTAAARATGSSIHVAVLADRFINDLKPITGGPAETEEREWVEAAVSRVSQWTGPARRDMFDDLGAAQPRWWSLYQAASQHV